eukprot:12301262-Alexandrium_andersonii.AAC.1
MTLPDWLLERTRQHVWLPIGFRTRSDTECIGRDLRGWKFLPLSFFARDTWLSELCCAHAVA